MVSSSEFSNSAVSNSTVSNIKASEVEGSDSESVRVLFNRIAPMYDTLNDRLSFGAHRIWKRMTVKWCEPFPGARGLDVCCGSGDLTRLLAQAVGPSGHVVGVDFAVDQLANAQRIAEQSIPPLPIVWVEGDALALPFEANRFDALTMGYGLRNVPDIEQALREMHRVLRPGAKAAILDFHRPDNPVMQQFQRTYLDTVVVPMARHFGVEAEYAYIWQSLQRFPNGARQVQLAHHAGFASVTHYAIAGGMMGVLVAQKPA